MTQSAHKPTATIAIAVLGLGITIAWGVAVALAAGRRNPIHIYNGAFAVAFVLYLIAAALIVSPRGGTLGRWGLPLILALALLHTSSSLASRPPSPTTTHRYIWDGKVIAAGIDPYRYAPDAPELADLRDPLWERVNQKSQHTPYPPAAQAVFALTYQLAPGSIKAQQVVATLADLAVIGCWLYCSPSSACCRAGGCTLRLGPAAGAPLRAQRPQRRADGRALILALALVIGPQGTTRAARISSGLALAFQVGETRAAPPRTALAAPLATPQRIALGAGWYSASALLSSAPTLTILNGLGTGAEAEAVFNDSLHYATAALLAPLGVSASTTISVLSAAALAAAALALLLRPPADDTRPGARRRAAARPRRPAQRRGQTLSARLDAPLRRRLSAPAARSPSPPHRYSAGSGSAARYRSPTLTYLSPDMARLWPLIRPPWNMAHCSFYWPGQPTNLPDDETHPQRKAIRLNALRHPGHLIQPFTIC
ncbi:MAG: hypothetical protein U0841_23805 [Chloroflexia bacterium]